MFSLLYHKITARQPIEKGWSGDKKYRVTVDGTDYLLRIAPKEKRERCRHQFENMQRAKALGIPMDDPVEFGESEDGVYTILRFIHGTDAEAYIPTLPVEKQYTYGLDAGRILAKLHTLPAPADAEDWERRFNRKIDCKIAMYEACPLKYDEGDAFLQHIASSRHLLKGRSQTWQHGDYHIGNMMMDENGVLTIIDFDRDDWGDPWEEFNRIVWCAQVAPAFASGMVDGYFGGNVPMEFWSLLALYISSNTLSSLPWAIPFGDGEVAVMRTQAEEILAWYDHFRTCIPNWYHKESL